MSKIKVSELDKLLLDPAHALEFLSKSNELDENLQDLQTQIQTLVQEISTQLGQKAERDVIDRAHRKMQLEGTDEKDFMRALHRARDVFTIMTGRPLIVTVGFLEAAEAGTQYKILSPAHDTDPFFGAHRTIRIAARSTDPKLQKLARFEVMTHTGQFALINPDVSITVSTEL